MKPRREFECSSESTSQEQDSVWPPNQASATSAIEEESATEQRKPFRQRGSTMPAITYRGGRWRAGGKSGGPHAAEPSAHSEHEAEFEGGGEYYRVRSYSVAGRVVTKCGESLRLRFQQHQQSTSSVASSCTSAGSVGAHSSASSSFRLRSWSHGSTSSELSASGNSDGGGSGSSVHRVAVFGASEVGKASLIAQFVSFDRDDDSLHIDEYKDNNEFNDPSVSVLLDGDESEIHFTKLNSSADISPEEFIFHHDMDAYIVVYSISDRASFKIALHFLVLLQAAELLSDKGVILVGNKIDLERSRAVATEEGREAATSYGCKFIETSEWMNHKVDELLVGVLSQIRLKQRQRTVQRSDSRKDRSRTGLLNGGSTGRTADKKQGKRRSRSVVRDLLRKFSFTSKSCDNLHVL